MTKHDQDQPDPQQPAPLRIECEFFDELDLYVLSELEPERMAELRAHVGECAGCALAAGEMQMIVTAVQAHGRDLESQITPIDVALVELMCAISAPVPVDFAPAQDLDVELDSTLVQQPWSMALESSAVLPIRERAVARRSGRARRRAFSTLAAAGIVICVGTLALVWHDDARQQRTNDEIVERQRLGEKTRVQLSGRDLELPERIDLSGLRRFDLVAGEDDWLFHLGAIALHVAPGARLRMADGGPPPRVVFQGGKAVVRTRDGEPMIVRIGDLELLIAGASVVALELASDDALDTPPRVVVGVYEGRATLARAGDLDATSPMASFDSRVLDAGATLALDLTTTPPVDVAAATLERLLENGALMSPDLVNGDTGATSALDRLPDDVAATDDPLTEWVPPTDPTESSDDPTTPDPVWDDETEPRESGLQPGTVMVSVPSGPVGLGETILITVTAGSGEIGLGSYHVEIDFSPGDSDLIVEIPSDVTTGRSSSFLTSHFDAGTQKLSVIESTTSRQPLGRGTFELFTVAVRIIASSAGAHPVGGHVVQVLDPATETLGVPRLLTQGAIDVR